MASTPQATKVQPAARSSAPLQARISPAAAQRGAQAARTAPGAAAERTRDELHCANLTPAEYAKWDELVDVSPHGTVFHYSWWLESIAPRLEILAVCDAAGKLLGGIPLPRARRWGMELVQSPALAPYLGPVFEMRGAEGNAERLGRMRRCGEALARSVNHFDSFRCVAGASAPDLQGMLWAGFRAELAYTFRFRAGAANAELVEGIVRTHRQQLAKARRLNLTVTQEDGVEELLRLSTQTFERQGLPSPYSAQMVRRLWTAAHGRQKANIYVARTAAGAAVAALLTVNDPRTTYQIVSGVDTAQRDIPGAYIVLWHAVEDALGAGREFDFEGSGLRGVERFYRRWGAAAAPVWKMEKAGSWRGALYQFLIRRRQKARLTQAIS